MIPADVASRLRLILPDQPTAPQAAIPAQQLKDVLSDLVPGQRVLAEIQALLPNGAYRAAIAQREITLALPFSAKPGDTLELEVVEKDNRIALAVVANRSTAEQLSAGESSASTTLSPAGRLIGTLMAEIGQTGEKAPPAVLNASKPLVAAPPDHAAELAPILKDALVKSGMFYESHQARWVAGQLPTAALLQEPQGQHAPAPTSASAPPPPSASTSPSSMQENPQASSAPEARAQSAPLPPQTSVEGDARPAPALSESTLSALGTGHGREPAGAGTPVVPAPLAPLVQQQLDALATQVFSWQGQVWPGQTMDWTIEDSPGSRTSPNEGEAAAWTTRLRLKLPHLGLVDATLHLAEGNEVSLALAVSDPASRSILAGEGEVLIQRFADAGLRISGLRFDHGAEPE